MHAMIFFLLTQAPRDIFYTLELTEYMQITSSKILWPDLGRNMELSCCDFPHDNTNVKVAYHASLINVASLA